MSIAVSAVVRPSKLLRLLIGILVVLAIVSIGSVTVLARLSSMTSIVLIAAFAGILHLAIVRANWLKKSLHIDISGNGQITVEEDIPVCRAEAAAPVRRTPDAGKAFRLMPDSTIWPHLLLLRLRAEDHTIRNLLVLPDCMDEASFRALSVACRWIGTRNDPMER